MWVRGALGCLGQRGAARLLRSPDQVTPRGVLPQGTAWCVAAQHALCWPGAAQPEQEVDATVQDLEHVCCFLLYGGFS